MPRVLTNEVGSVSLTNIEYLNLMRLLYRSGWRPEGTLAPAGWKPRRRKDGQKRVWPKMNYFSRMGQEVTDMDALAMAAAIESVLPDVPEHDAMEHKIGQVIDLPYRAPIRMPRVGVRYNAFEFFSGQSRDLLVRFSEMCRAGGYHIG